MATWVVMEGTRQFITGLLIGLCTLLGVVSAVGIAAVVIALVRIGREKGGAKDGPHRGTIGDGKL